MRLCVCMCVRARAFLVMHAHMCSGPIGLVTALQSAILIMQHFIKSSRWVSEWEEAERAEREKEGEEKDRKQRERERERERETEREVNILHVCMCVCGCVHAASLTATEYLSSPFVHASVSCHYASVCYLLSLCICLWCAVSVCVCVQVCTCLCPRSPVHVFVCAHDLSLAVYL